MPHASCSILCPDHLPLPVLEVTAFSVILSSAFSSHSAHVPWVTMSTPLLQLPSLQIRISGPPSPCLPTELQPHTSSCLVESPFAVPQGQVQAGMHPGPSLTLPLLLGYASWKQQHPTPERPIRNLEVTLYTLSLSHPCAPCIFLPTLLCSGRHSKVPQTA